MQSINLSKPMRMAASAIVSSTRALSSLCAGALLLLLLHPAGAQTGFNTVVFLSNGASTGVPCGTCGSLAAALQSVSAGGNIVCLGNGQFWPQTTITGSVTIDCHDASASVISCGGVTINAPGATVALRNLSLLGQGC